MCGSLVAPTAGPPNEKHAPWQTTGTELWQRAPRPCSEQGKGQRATDRNSMPVQHTTQKTQGKARPRRVQHAMMHAVVVAVVIKTGAARSDARGGGDGDQDGCSM